MQRFDTLESGQKPFVERPVTRDVIGIRVYEKGMVAPGNACRFHNAIFLRVEPLLDAMIDD